MSNTKGSKTDTAIDRKLAAVRMNNLFTTVRAQQKEKPERWNKDKRTDVNERIKLIQFLFDEGNYAHVVDRCEEVDYDYRLSPREPRQPRAPRNEQASRPELAGVSLDQKGPGRGNNRGPRNGKPQGGKPQNNGGKR